MRAGRAIYRGAMCSTREQRPASDRSSALVTDVESTICRRHFDDLIHIGGEASPRVDHIEDYMDHYAGRVIWLGSESLSRAVYTHNFCLEGQQGRIWYSLGRAHM